MAHVFITITGVQGLEGTSNLGLAGHARTSDMTAEDETINFVASVDIGGTLAAATATIKAAAVAAVTAAGRTVTGPDNKFVIGIPVSV